MKDRFNKLTKHALFASCLAMTLGGFYSCKDDYTLDDDGNNPSFLGKSIYDELKDPSSSTGLTGSFSNTIRLIDDLNYREILQKTGSKTLFVANDEAFSRFFNMEKKGIWKDVKSYEDLTNDMKIQLLYTAMLDNALLREMLSNVPGDNGIEKGVAIKHETNVQVINGITHFAPAELPVNNKNWDYHRQENVKGIDLVLDATRPMVVHFTEEQMTKNSITTEGENSDFEIITGASYSEGKSYVFRNEVVQPDITCKNGYIHQLKDVLLPPGNIAELIRTNGETNLFSRMLDRFSVPVYNREATNNYKSWAESNNITTSIDSIFEKRYMNSSQNHSYEHDYFGVDQSVTLDFDPGWNQYLPYNTKALSDLCAIFAPTDEAMREYFINGGGKPIIQQYFNDPIIAQGLNPDDAQYTLEQKIDSIPLEIVQKMLVNLMQPSFLSTVPSKFKNMVNDAKDAMGLTVNDINKKDGTFDVQIANNGVLYCMNTMIAPVEFDAVSAMTTFSNEMDVFKWMINDGRPGHNIMNINFYAYLLAMGANYAFFIPDDEAFATYYVDPASLVKDGTPRVLKFTTRRVGKDNYNLVCESYPYNVETGEVGTQATAISNLSNVATQITDILNYHTVVLAAGDTIGKNLQNKYYKTKHGGEIMIDLSKNEISANVNLAQNAEFPLAPAAIKDKTNYKNGVSYRINHVIQPTTTSVYAVMKANNDLSDFFTLCEGEDEVMKWAVSNTNGDASSIAKNAIAKYTVFIDGDRDGDGTKDFNVIDYNVSFFSTYNYTVYAPNNKAMAEARSKGLPTWDDVMDIMNDTEAKLQAARDGGMDPNSDEYKAIEEEGKSKAMARIEVINKFIRYHFQDNAIYCDKTFDNGSFSTSCTDSLGMYLKVKVDGSNDRMVVTDNQNNTVTITPNDGLSINNMARDYELASGNKISTSSFAVVHEIASTLNYQTKGQSGNGRYDVSFASDGAAKRNLAKYKKWYKKAYGK